MPSPFPGMDPWLEDPADWPDVHDRLIAEIQSALNRVIRPKYRAVVQGRIYADDLPESDRVPDVQVRQQRPDPAPGVSGPIVTEPVVLRAVRQTVREPRVQLVEARSRVVVTVIEVLSPANKRAGTAGRASFLTKRRQVLRSLTNWVEIDLLRAGEPTFRRPRRSSGQYAVHVSPVELRPKTEVWPVQLTDRLPVIRVPLREPDPPVPLDLQAVFSSGYEQPGYDGAVDYRRPAVPPLPPELDAWADALLREKGLR